MCHVSWCIATDRHSTVLRKVCKKHNVDGPISDPYLLLALSKLACLSDPSGATVVLRKRWIACSAVPRSSNLKPGLMGATITLTFSSPAGSSGC